MECQIYVEKIRGLKIYSEKVKGLKILCLSEGNTPGGYSSLKMSAPLEAEKSYQSCFFRIPEITLILFIFLAPVYISSPRLRTPKSHASTSFNVGEPGAMLRRSLGSTSSANGLINVSPRILFNFRIRPSDFSISFFLKHSFLFFCRLVRYHLGGLPRTLLGMGDRETTYHRLLG